MVSSLALVPRGASAAGRREVAALTSATAAPTRVRRKSFLDKGTRVLCTQGVRVRWLGGRRREAGSQEPRGKNQVGRSRAPQVSAGTAGPARAARPPPPRPEPLPAAAAAAAQAGPGSALGAETRGSGRSCLGTRGPPPASAAPCRSSLSPPRAALRREGAGGRRRRRAEEEKESKERTVPGEEPAPAAAASPLPPAFPPR